MNRTQFGISAAGARWLGAMLAIALLIGSLPLTAGVTFINVSDHPTLSLDLCHPLQMAAAGTIGVVARPAPIEFKPCLFASANVTFAGTPFLSRLSDAPESPPPEALA